MRTVLIKNAQIVNEGTITSGDVLIEADRIAEIAPSISVKNADTKVIDADGFYLIPRDEVKSVCVYYFGICIFYANRRCNLCNTICLNKNITTGDGSFIYYLSILY